MNFYLKAFFDLLKENGIRPEILSNFNLAGQKSALPNIFTGIAPVRVANLLLCYFILFKAICKIRDQEFVVVTFYGLIFELPILLISKLSKRVILDVHEVVALDSKNNLYRKLICKLFKSCPNLIISHSDRTSATLTQFSFSGQIIFVPHFHYNISTNYNNSNIGEDVQKIFQKQLVKFLFFGNIRPSKGIFDLLAAIKQIPPNKINIVIAGQDLFNNITQYNLQDTDDRNLNLVLRRLNDDEMKFLFSGTDYVILPYQTISQSGVLEMAIAFRKPVLTSNITYFRSLISNYPSFGRCINTKNSHEFSLAMTSLPETISAGNFYRQSDLDRYFNKNIFKRFVENLKSYNDNFRKV